MADSDLVQELIRDAFAELDRVDSPLTPPLRKVLRIARLRADYAALYEFSYEMLPNGDSESRRRLFAEVAPHYNQDEMKRLHGAMQEQYLLSRKMGYVGRNGTVETDKVTALCVPELDSAIVQYQADASPRPAGQGLHTLDAHHFAEKERVRLGDVSFSLHQLRQVRSRLAQRAHEYLSLVERQIHVGHMQSDIFEQNRQYVDKALTSVAPNALDQLRSAYMRVREGTTEARSHALTSVRRALKSLADRLYPARATPVVGIDGKERILNEQQFLSRLWQYIAEAKANASSKELLVAETTELGRRIDSLNDLASKGVHDKVTEFEVNICVLGAYTVIGAILRLHDQSSAASMSLPDLSVSARTRS